MIQQLLPLYKSTIQEMKEDLDGIDKIKDVGRKVLEIWQVEAKYGVNIDVIRRIYEESKLSG